MVWQYTRGSAGAFREDFLRRNSGSEGTYRGEEPDGGRVSVTGTPRASWVGIAPRWGRSPELLFYYTTGTL
jgi:hypothetical protein